MKIMLSSRILGLAVGVLFCAHAHAGKTIKDGDFEKGSREGASQGHRTVDEKDRDTARNAKNKLTNWKDSATGETMKGDETTGTAEPLDSEKSNYRRRYYASTDLYYTYPIAYTGYWSPSSYSYSYYDYERYTSYTHSSSYYSPYGYSSSYTRYESYVRQTSSMYYFAYQRPPSYYSSYL